MIAQLKASCDGLSEEQLAKLGVILFNCQAESEGRRTYPCTEEMVSKRSMEKKAELLTHASLFPPPHFDSSDFERVHGGHGFGHVERLPHHQQQSALCLLLGSPAAVSTQSRAHGQCSHLHGNKPTRCNEGPQGTFAGWTAGLCISK